MNRRQKRQRLMSEINVVPYIDVMLVLLIIFMITAPLITQGVKIELPQAPAEMIPAMDIEPVIVTINEAGKVYIDFGDAPEKPLKLELLVKRVTKLLKLQPAAEILVRGDRSVAYGRVIEVMSALQSAGVEDVGLVTGPPDAR